MIVSDSHVFDNLTHGVWWKQRFTYTCVFWTIAEPFIEKQMSTTINLRTVLVAEVQNVIRNWNKLNYFYQGNPVHVWFI